MFDSIQKTPLKKRKKKQIILYCMILHNFI